MTWQNSDDYPGYVEKRLQSGVNTVRIYRPILDPEARIARETQVERAMEHLYVDR